MLFLISLHFALTPGLRHCVPFYLSLPTIHLLLFCYLFGLNVKSFALLIHKISFFLSAYVFSQHAKQLKPSLFIRRATGGWRAISQFRKSWYGGLCVEEQQQQKRRKSWESWKSLWLSPHPHPLVSYDIHFPPHSRALSMNSHEHQTAQLSSDFDSHTITISPWSSAVSEQRNFHFCASSLFGIIHQIFSTCSLQLNPRATRAQEWTFSITFCDDIISHSYNNGSAKAAADAERWTMKKERGKLSTTFANFCNNLRDVTWNTFWLSVYIHFSGYLYDCV